MRWFNRTAIVAVSKFAYETGRYINSAIKDYADLERQHAKTMGALASKFDKTNEAQKRFIQGSKELRESAIQQAFTGPTGQGSLYTPAQISQAHTALAKAGVEDPAAIARITPNILKFAGGNDISPEKGAEYAINLSKMWNIPLEDIGTSLDMVTKSADMSTINIDQLFQSMKYAGPIANSLNRDLEETLALIVELGNKGIKGSMAGTGIQAMITKIMSPIGKGESGMASAPSDYSREIFQAFSQEILTPEGNLKPLEEVMNMFNEVAMTLNDQETAWFAHKLIGLRQMKAILSLSTGGSELGVTAEQIVDSQGAVDLKWDQMINSAFGRGRAYDVVKEAVRTDIGARLEPATNAMFDELIAFLQNPQTYTIDYTKLRTKFKEAGGNIAERYGDDAGAMAEEIFDLRAKATVGGIANLPLIGGIGGGVVDLLEGDFIGAVQSVRDGFDKTTENINQLDPELQEMATGIRNVVTALTVLATLNIGTKILEMVTRALGTITGVANMNVAAGNVIVGGAGGGLGPYGNTGTGALAASGALGGSSSWATMGLSGALAIGGTGALMYGLNRMQENNPMATRHFNRMAYDVRNNAGLADFNAGMANSMAKVLNDKVTLQPPNVKVEVNVDQNGKYSTTTFIGDQSMINSAEQRYDMISSRYGDGARQLE